jgi:hypothetical protein
VNPTQLGQNQPNGPNERAQQREVGFLGGLPSVLELDLPSVPKGPMKGLRLGLCSVGTGDAGICMAGALDREEKEDWNTRTIRRWHGWMAGLAGRPRLWASWNASTAGMAGWLALAWMAVRVMVEVHSFEEPHAREGRSP